MRPTAPLPAPVHRTDDIREVLAYLPHRIGYRPRDCLVAVSLRATGTVGLVARVDTEDLLAPHATDVARALAARLHEDLARRVLLVVYTADDPRDPHHLRPDPAGRPCRAAALLGRALVGVPAVGPWVVTANGYLGLGCTDPDCCPPGGRPLADLAGTAIGARMVLAGSVVADTRDQVALVAPAGSRARRAAGAARLRWAQSREQAGHDPAAVRRWRDRSFLTWQRSLRLPDGAGTADHGRLEAALTDCVLRDAVLISLIAADHPAPSDDRDPADRGTVRPLDEPDVQGRAERSAVEPHEEADDTTHAAAESHDEAGRPDRPRADGLAGTGDDSTTGRHGELTGDGLARAMIALGDGPRRGAGPRQVDRAVRDAIAGLVAPGRARRPDPGRLRRATRVLEGVLAHGRHDGQAPALTLLGLVAWWEGDGVRADVLLGRALADDPDYVLAGQLRRALALGLPPGWVRAA